MEDAIQLLELAVNVEHPKAESRSEEKRIYPEPQR
jgi:hypothetical protein